MNVNVNPKKVFTFATFVIPSVRVIIFINKIRNMIFFILGHQNVCYVLVIK